MKSISVVASIAFITTLAATDAANATEVGNQRIFGVGLALGDPTSLVGKVFVDAGRAVDVGLSFGRFGYGRCYNGRGYYYCDRHGFGDDLGISADYLWQYNIVHDSVTLDWHIGAGGRVWFFDNDNYDPAYRDGDTLALGARMPLGLDLMFNKPEFLEVYVELTPTLFIVPGMDLDFEGVLGARLYF